MIQSCISDSYYIATGQHCPGGYIKERKIRCEEKKQKTNHASS